jgi:manganese transport protein
VSRPDDRSLPEMHRTVGVPPSRSWIRRMFAFAGPAYLVSVGYMDPGNWATDLAGGSRFGYQLVWVLLMSNMMAVLLQTLAARLGVVTGRDLAQACREYYPRFLVWPQWLLCELAIVACDLAEVLGAAIGLKLLFGIPLAWGVLITAGDVMVLLLLARYGMRRLEAVIITLIATMGACFAIEMLLSRPDFAGIFSGFVPRDANGQPTLFAAAPGGGWSVLGLYGDRLFIALGILGATVMPHNLYLHSALVQSRAVAPTTEGKREACRLNLVDTIVALNAAFFVNAAILILAAAAFHSRGRLDVASLEQAYQLLTPLLGTALASTLFAVALLSSGQSSTITGTLAGQIVMEGFIRVRMRPWLRRMLSRGLAIVPAVLVIVLKGESAVDALLVLSQVVLSVQLSFAVIPLVVFTSDRRRMGDFVNPPWVIALAVLVASLIAGLNAKLVFDAVKGAIEGGVPWVGWVALPLALALAAMLVYLAAAPWISRLRAPAAPVAPVPAAPVLAIGSRHALQPHAAGVASHVPAINAGAYQRIAVALELGRSDPSVLEFLRSLSFAPGAELVLVHVVESAASRYLGAQSLDEESREDQSALEAIAGEFRLKGVATQAVLGHGDAKREIARLVRELKADLLVTGSHGHTGLRDVVYGATVSAVRHLVDVPVLTVPPPRE